MIAADAILMPVNIKQAEVLIRQLRVLVVDDNPFARTIVRGLLGSLNVKRTIEADDGVAALALIRAERPDVVILDWEMPHLSGADVVRSIRSPGVFPLPDLPIIMLTGHIERWRILESAKLGVNEFLCKPVSANALFQRLVSILLKPRACVQIGSYYGPAPRRAVADTTADEPTAC